MASPGKGQKVGRSTRGYSSRPDKVLPTLKIRNRQRREFKAIKAAIAEQQRAVWREQAARRRAAMSPEDRARKREQERASRARRRAAMTDRQRAEERVKRNARRRAVRARQKAAAAAQGPAALLAFLEQQRAAWRSRMARRKDESGLSRWQRMSPAQRRRHTAAGVAKRRARREAARAADRAKLLADPVGFLLSRPHTQSLRSPLARELER